MFFNRYGHVAIDGFKGAPEAAEIANIEEELGCSLPTYFLEFLGVANGGSVDGYCSTAHLGHGPVELDFPSIYFAGKDQRGSYGPGTFVGEIREERRCRKVPRKVLPFARGGGGSVVYLDLRTGCVTAYVHGLPEWAGGPRRDQFVQLASNFADYVMSLHVDHVDEAEAREWLEQAIARRDREQIAANEEFLDIALPDWRERFKK